MTRSGRAQLFKLVAEMPPDDRARISDDRIGDDQISDDQIGDAPRWQLFKLLVEELVEMPPDDRARFLDLVTASPRLPPGGLPQAAIKARPPPTFSPSCRHDAFPRDGGKAWASRPGWAASERNG